jgi:hypothetical protein
MHRIPSRAMDTSPEAERVQVELLRSVPVSRRLHLACSLSAAIVSVARRALARADPGAGQAELDLRFVELHYGSALAAALRAELMKRQIAESGRSR